MKNTSIKRYQASNALNKNTSLYYIFGLIACRAKITGFCRLRSWYKWLCKCHIMSLLLAMILCGDITYQIASFNVLSQVKMKVLVKSLCGFYCHEWVLTLHQQNKNIHILLNQQTKEMKIQVLPSIKPFNWKKKRG